MDTQVFDFQALLLDFLKILAGIVIGWIVNPFKDRISNWRTKSKWRRRMKKVQQAFNNENFRNNLGGVIRLESAVPSWESNNIKLSHNAKEFPDFYYPIPSNKIELLQNAGFTDSGRYVPKGRKKPQFYTFDDSANCLSSSFSDVALTKLNAGLACFNRKWDLETQAEILEIAESVADEMISDLNAGKCRFNGAMYGVGHFSHSRSEGSEEPIVIIQFYVTNFFTFRVFANFYQKHKAKLLQSANQYISKETINSLAYPFLSSFGIATIAVLSYNDVEEMCEKEDCMIIGKRSNEVKVDPNVYHYTMNEAFSLGDKSSRGALSIEMAATRGFYEEIGLEIRNDKNRTTSIKGTHHGGICFMDFLFDSNKCEMGVNSYIRIKINEGVNPGKFVEDFKACRSVARDGHMETTGFVLQPIGDIKAFLEKNKNTEKEKKISWCLNFTLSNMADRFEKIVL